MLSRLLYGGRVSIVGVGATAISLVVGVAIGAFCGTWAARSTRS